MRSAMKKWLFLAISGLLVVIAAIIEVRTSYFQASLFTRLASETTYDVKSGPGTVRFPQAGPYNTQQGFSRIPHFIERLEKHGFKITRQTDFSHPLIKYVDLGGNPPYPEKTQSGLAIYDEQGHELYSARQPAAVYEHFSEIPPLLVTALLFIENRELLSDGHPNRNPAVEWDRLAEALISRLANVLDRQAPTPGGSTLATQLEKFRYSSGGVTADVPEKLRQMVSASVRAYQYGANTYGVRERVVRDYLNATPLSGRAGFGEVHGIGDGLWAWYGVPFQAANQALLDDTGNPDNQEKARIFKYALSLLLSQRRPSYYLLSGRQKLEQLTDSYLRIMGQQGVINQGLMKTALAQPLVFRDRAPVFPSTSFVEQKAVTNVRTDLLNTLGVENLYTLDRLDLAVTTSVATRIQADIQTHLSRLTEPDYARTQGLLGTRLLTEDQLDSVRYSVLLFESTPRGNLLRVQTDNLDMPFDMNDGSKLDLGSTAKLRTLISYLDVVETLYRRHARKNASELASEGTGNDPLTRWVIAYLSAYPDANLEEILDAAMHRTYSANPNEGFFTAGGLHYFHNFDRKDNGRIMTVEEAFNRSVNLVFIRVMRDVAHFHTQEIPGANAILENRQDPRRKAYLTRFALQEGAEYLRRFYHIYAPLSAEQQISRLAQRVRATPYRMAMAFRSARPEAGMTELAEFLALKLGDNVPEPDEIAELYVKYDPERFNSNDRAYLADLHPLELWLLKELQTPSERGFSDLLAASDGARLDAYQWLFKPRKWRAQNKRIRILLEQEAFAAIHGEWQRLGYPFPVLVPSYATALGASADRPAALAELMGIIVNDGRRLPMRQLQRLAFAEGTPYETVLDYRSNSAQQVLSRELCSTVRRALNRVVETGTARRLNDVFRDAENNPLEIGGKTGTGDHRSKHYAAGGRLVGETVMNRNALFAFYIGDRYFGVILAHVGGEEAKDFDFTSGLAAQLLITLQPALQPLLEGNTDFYVGVLPASKPKNAEKSEMLMSLH